MKGDTDPADNWWVDRRYTIAWCAKFNPARLRFIRRVCDGFRRFELINP